MVSSSSRAKALGRQTRRASSRAAVSPVCHSCTARSCWVLSRLAMARSLLRLTPWSSPRRSFTARIRGSSSTASSVRSSGTVTSVISALLVCGPPAYEAPAQTGGAADRRLSARQGLAGEEPAGAGEEGDDARHRERDAVAEPVRERPGEHRPEDRAGVLGHLEPREHLAAAALVADDVGHRGLLRRV